MNLDSLVMECVKVALAAGEAIEENSNNFDIDLKPDHSPVTNADLAAERVILSGLGAFGLFGHDYPILSEESHQNFVFPQGRYWCVDPLDGTRDFIGKTGDYTVNIALMEAGQPLLGVVHAPHSKVTYFAGVNGAFKLENGLVSSIRVKKINSKKMTALISRYHANSDLVQKLQLIPDLEIIQRGSAIKLCVIAEGMADLYPRLTPCRDWDIAAAHCVLRAAGGEIFTYSLKPMRYNSSDPWLIRGFFAVNQPKHDWLPLISKLPKI